MRIDFDKILKTNAGYNNFMRDFRNGNLSRGYLFIGEDKVLRDEVLIRCVKTMFCTSENKPCGECAECAKIDNHNNLDVMYFGGDSFTKNDALRLKDECIVRPMTGDIKLLVVPNADAMEELTQNKLLKTLEELPSYIMVILSVSSETLVLPTIRSRMRKVYVGSGENAVKEFLSGKPYADEIALCSNGLLQEAESLAKDVKFINYYEFAMSLLNDFPNSRVLGEKGRFFVEHKNDTIKILRILMYVMYDNMKQNKTTYPTEALPNCIRAVGRGLEALDAFANPNAVIDNVLLTILEEKSKCK